MQRFQSRLKESKDLVTRRRRVATRCPYPSGTDDSAFIWPSLRCVDALVNGTRKLISWRAILARLAKGEATVNELAAPFEITLPSISKHIKVLQQAGLVVRGHHAQYRPCALDAAPLKEIATWAEQYRRVWEGSFDRMDAYLTQLRAEPRAGGNDE